MGTDSLVAILGALTALITATAALVTAIATALWTWKQQQQITHNSQVVRHHLRECPGIHAGASAPAAPGQREAAIPIVPEAVKPSV